MTARALRTGDAVCDGSGFTGTVLALVAPTLGRGLAVREEVYVDWNITGEPRRLEPTQEAIAE